MGLFGKPKTHKITGSFHYVPIRDPRKKKITTEDLIPAMPGGDRTGDEFLEKYLYIVRNHMSRESSLLLRECTTWAGYALGKIPNITVEQVFANWR